MDVSEMEIDWSVEGATNLLAMVVCIAIAVGSAKDVHHTNTNSKSEFFICGGWKVDLISTEIIELTLILVFTSFLLIKTAYINIFINIYF